MCAAYTCIKCMLKSDKKYRAGLIKFQRELLCVHAHNHTDKLQVLCVSSFHRPPVKSNPLHRFLHSWHTPCDSSHLTFMNCGNVFYVHATHLHLNVYIKQNCVGRPCVFPCASYHPTHCHSLFHALPSRCNT